jgi:hypothetical protein
MTLGRDPLDRLSPALPWEANWSDVLDRAGERRPYGRRAPAFLSVPRLLLAVILLIALLIPLAAFGAAKQHWFWWAVRGPAPVTTPNVIKEGEWSGHPWQLVAYRSANYGLCWSISPKNSAADGSGGGVLACGPIEGVPRTPTTNAAPDAEILYAGGGATSQLPAFVAGPVIDKASQVAIQFEEGEVLRVPTFSGPDSLGSVRFYATEVPTGIFPPPRPGETTLFGSLKLAGLDDDGNVVACLARTTARGGISPLSDCQALGGHS